MTKLYVILGIAAVIGIGAVGLSVGSTGGSAVAAPIDVEGLDDPERLVALAQGVSKGEEDAPFAIIEFGDFQCPGCGSFAAQVKPQVELNLVESGRARFVFYDFPITNIHPNAFLAARASRCAADQDRYWEYHDNLFRTQGRWSTLSNPVGMFVEFSRSLNMDDGEFESCLNSDRHADVVTANMELGVQLGVSGTPTVLIENDGQWRPVRSDYGSILEHIEGLEEGEGQE